MSEEDDPKHPLWHAQDSPEPPKELWAGFYEGLTGRWISTSHGYTEDTPRFIVGQLDRPGKILKYELVEVIDYPIEERMKYRRKKPWQRRTKEDVDEAQEKPVKTRAVKERKVKQPMKVRKVRKPK